MDGSRLLRPIAHIRTDFSEKFGIPRQSGLVPELEGTVVFEPCYRDPDALRGIEQFSHLWLVWGFTHAERKGSRTCDAEGFAPLVRPPRLGGNATVGGFASRSPFRPNGLGLSCVRLVGVEDVAGQGRVLRVRGADMLDGTPIYDVKPYVRYADSWPEACSGYAEDPDEKLLEVECSREYMDLLGNSAPAVLAVLARDPRPAYHNDPERIYELTFAEHAVYFRVHEDKLSVVKVEHAR